MGALRLEVVWRGPTEVDAVLTVGQLRAAGIEAAIESSGTPYGATAFPLGGTWQIRVRLEDVEAARRVLVEAGEGGNLVVEEASGGLLNADQRATLRVAGLAAVAFVVVVVLLSLREAWG
ncbi:hypothetical protein [Tepidiforma sp.]|uniref:hypothetical protein n=1 Tax=Tepidiforma sp. TaxID=2682230 RepID=UPI002ADD5E49|nr:hypothetical protein [Tepidiforma sp.]